MSVAGASTLLLSFKTKIDEAVSLVPGMVAEEKLKAVQFWNVVSERLQEIVNNSAADINALALKLEKENAEKLAASRHHATSSDLASNDVQSSGSFLNHSTGYASVPSFTDNSHPFGNTGSLTSDPQLQFLTQNTQIALPLPPPPLPAMAPSVVSHATSLPRNTAMGTVASSPSESALPSPLIGQPLLEAPKESVLNHDSHLQNDELTHSVLSQSDKSSSLACDKRLRKSNLSLNQGQNHDSNILSTSPTANITVLKDSWSRLKPKKSLLTKMLNNTKTKPPRNVRKQSSVSGLNTKKSDGSQKPSLLSDADKKVELKNETIKLPKDDELVQNSDDKQEQTTEVVVIQADGNIEKVQLDSRSKRGRGRPNRGSYICEWCNKKLPNSSTLTSHRWVHTKPYACTECSARFSAKGNLVVHTRRHTGEKPYACEQCDASFSTKGNLKRHVKTHSGEKPWQCLQCGNRFTEKKSLKVHMRRHTGERPYQCKVCGKSFAQTGILQTHMAMHLDQKAHLCEYCGKSFRQKSQLRLHMLRHEGVRKYLCPACPARFLTKGDLERHTRIHTGERPFICELCGKSFTRQQSLNEHMNRHYGLKPYECKYCGKGFAEMSACYKHIKQHERVQSITTDDIPDQVSVDQQGDLSLVEDQNTDSEVVDLTDQVIQGDFNDTDSEKFTVLVETHDQPVDINSEITEQDDTSIIPNNSEHHITVAVTDAMSDFTAINLLASASSYQQNY